MRQYLAKLQKIADDYGFGPYYEEAIRDGFVYDLRSQLQSIQRKLLAEATLTLQTAVEKA